MLQQEMLQNAELPLSNYDRETMQMVREVLEQRNAIDKFGVMLANPHNIELKPNEILVEETNEATRVQTIQPVPINELAKKGEQMITQWIFTDNKVIPFLSCIIDLTTGRHKKQEF